MRAVATGFGTASLSRWLPLLAETAAADPNRVRSCILLWMPGGPSQLDTFDLKPEHANAGEFKPIETTVSGIQISEHLPQLSRQAEHLAIIRSMQTKEGDHGRATYHLRTGYRPQGPVQYPTLGSLVSHERGPVTDLPNYVSVLPNSFLSPAAFGPGFLGPKHAPLVVGADRAAARSGVAVPMSEDFGPPLEVRNLQSVAGVDLAQIIVA